MEKQSGHIHDGGAWAAILAGGIGCASIGILVDLAEASKTFSAKLALSSSVGDLSGKTTYGIACWLAAWAILHLLWRRRDLAAPGRIAAVTVVLLIIAMIAAFPPFFGLFSNG
jgi:hypothetical protein